MKTPPSLGKKRKKLLPYFCQTKWYNGSSWSARNKTFTPTDAISGSDNPKWEERIEAGLDAGSSYTRNYSNKVIAPGNGEFTWTQWKDNNKKSFYTYVFNGAIGLWSMDPTLSFAAPDTLSAQSQAKIAFLGKIRENQTPFQALPFFGELKETIGMLRSPFKGIRRHTVRYNRTVRRLGRNMSGKAAGHIADAIADAYLQWTYGVVPLINDVESIMTAAKDLLSSETADIPLSVTVKTEAMGPGSMTFNGPSSSARVVWYNHRTARVKVQIKGALKSDVSHPLQNRVQVKVGLQLTEFVPTAWELLPYSFLIDYFSNVGDVLGAAVTSTAAMRWYWMSTKVTKRVTCFGMALPTTGIPRSHRGSAGPAIIETMSFNRSKPALSVSLRDFRLQLPNLGQTINTLVLGFAAVRR